LKLTDEKLNSIIDRGVEFGNKYTLPLIVFNVITKETKIATGIIIETDFGPAITTAGHVLEELQKYNKDGRLQIGAEGYVLKDININQIKISKKVDFGYILLTPKEVNINKWNILPVTNISSDYPKKLDLVVYIGFPGNWKTITSDNTMTLSSFATVGSIETIEDDQFSIRLDEKRYNMLGSKKLKVTDLRGISGSPVFSIFDFWNSKHREPLLIGWIYEGQVWNELTQKHYAIHSDVISLITNEFEDSKAQR